MYYYRSQSLHNSSLRNEPILFLFYRQANRFGEANTLPESQRKRWGRQDLNLGLSNSTAGVYSMVLHCLSQYLTTENLISGSNDKLEQSLIRVVDGLGYSIRHDPVPIEYLTPFSLFPSGPFNTSRDKIRDWSLQGKSFYYFVPALIVKNAFLILG